MSNHVSRFGRFTNPPDYPFSISLHFSCCRLTFCLFFLLFLAFPSLMVADEATDPGQITFRTSISNFDFEKIDPYTGHLTLTNKDVSLPGNGGLDLNIYRVYKYSRATTGYTPFGYHWELHFGRLRKSGSSVQIELQDGTDNVAYKAEYDTIWDSNYTYLTKDFWKVDLQGTPKLQLPDGTKIIFGRGGTTSYDKWYYATEIHRNNASPITIHYGTNRKISYVIDSVGRRLDFHYDSQSAGNLASITWGGRTLVTYHYPGSGNFAYWLDRVELPDGDTWHYQYAHFSFGQFAPGHNGISSIITPYGAQITYDYDRFTRGYDLATVIMQTSISQKSVSGSGVPNGTWDYDYGIKDEDGWGNPMHLDYTTITDSCGRKTIFHFFGYSGGYDTAGENNCSLYGLVREKFTTDAQGHIEEAVDYTWDQLDDPISEVAAYGVPHACYDSDVYVPVLSEQIIYHGGFLSNWYWYDMDPAKWEVLAPTDTYVTRYKNFDDYGNTRTIQEYDRKPVNNYTPALRTTTKTFWYNPDENIVKDKPATIHIQGSSAFPGTFQSGYGYDSFGNVLTENKYGVETTHTYHNNGNLRSTTDANNHTTWYSWQYGAISEIENPEYTITRTINPDGTIANETNGRGYTTHYTYTPGMRIKRETPPAGNPTVYTYHFGSNSYVRKTRGGFSTWTYYDGLGRERGTRDSVGKTTAIAYKPCGLKNYTTSNTGDTTRFDALGRVTRITHKDGKSIVYDNQADSDIIITDEAGKKTTLHYATFGAPGEKYLTSVKDALNHTATFKYNILGNLTQASFDGVTRRYQYNDKNFLVRETHPESGITAYTHDEVGNIRTKDDGLTTKIYSYDGINRLKSVSAGSQVLGYQYDDADNLTRLTSPDGTIRYTYDPANRLTGASTSTLGASGSLNFSWDNNDNLVTIGYPSGNNVRYTYNTLNQVTRVSGFGGSVSSISYYTSGEALGLLKSFRFGNGRTTTLYYDKRRAMTRTHSPALDLGFQYSDSRGNMTRLINYLNRSRDKSFSYDNVSRLRVFNGPWGSGRFDYSTDGDRVRKIRGSTISYGYNANRMTSATGTSYAYNSDGDMTRMGNIYLDHTAFHRLWRIRKSGKTLARLGYDGNGNRIYRKAGSDTEIYLRGPDNNILADLDGSGRSKREYIFLNGKLVAKSGSSDRRAIVAPWLILLLGNNH